MNRNAVLTALGLIFLGIVLGVVAITGFQMTESSTAQQMKSVALGNQTYAPKDAMTSFRVINTAFMEVAKVVTPTVVSIRVKSSPKSATANNFRFFKKDDKGDKKKEDKGEGEEEDPSDLFRFFGPRGMDKMPQIGSGSGVILTPDGYILTNNHVIKDADEKGGITVQLSDKREFAGKLIGTDPLTDIAVVKIEAKDLPAVPVGDSDGVQVGEWVLAVGNPFRLTSTVTAGIVSAIGRNIDIIRDGDGYGVESFIQTDAAVNPGNSGGALVNMEGRLVGINTAIATETGSYAGYSFAVPINLAKSVAEDLIKFGKITRGYIGVQLKPSFDATDAKAVGLDKPEGAFIQGILPDGAAAQAGIKEGDVILSADGKKIEASNDLQAYIARKHPNEKVSLKIWRDRKEIDIAVTLKPRKESPTADASPVKEDKKEPSSTDTASLEALGIEVKNLSAAERKQYDTDAGVRISDINPYGKAYQRLFKGDVILEIDRKKVSTVDDFKRITSSLKAGDAVLLKLKNTDKTTRLQAVEMAAK